MASFVSRFQDFDYPKTSRFQNLEVSRSWKGKDSRFQDFTVLKYPDFKISRFLNFVLENSKWTHPPPDPPKSRLHAGSLQGPEPASAWKSIGAWAQAPGPGRAGLGPPTWLPGYHWLVCFQEICFVIRDFWRHVESLLIVVVQSSQSQSLFI